MSNPKLEWDGKPDCPKCFGRGVVPIKGQSPMGGTTPCQCVLGRLLAANLNRGWTGLSKAAKIPSSPLTAKQVTKNLKVTGTIQMFREHLKHVAIRQGPNWNFRVVSDSDLMDSWLARVDEVYDADVDQMRQRQVTSKYGALVDLIDPPALLVILLGVKMARNSAMPEVLLETLKHREYVEKPTWVVDQPDCLLQAGHLAYDLQVEYQLRLWEKIVLQDNICQPGNGVVRTFQMSVMPKDQESVTDSGPLAGISTEKRKRGRPRKIQ